MVLSELLKAIQPIQIIGSTETEITGVNIDSRLVQAGHHLHSSERQRRRCRQSSHYILRRSYFQDGTSRRNRNEWENDHRHLII